MISAPINVSGQFEVEPTQSFEDCFNGLDDDGDGLVDIEDTDCGTNQPTFEDCFNGLDDDGDGLIDGQDEDCASLITSPPPPTCGTDEHLENGVCVANPPPPPPTCGTDEHLENGVCVANPPPPQEECGNAVDDNGDGQVDEGCTSTSPDEVPQQPLEVPPPGQGTGTAPEELPQQPPQEPVAKYSDCPNNMTITHCLPPADVSLTDFQQNSAPVANAGEDQEADENSLVTLDGTNSHDNDGNITAFSWVQTAGDELVTISEANSPHPSFYVPNVESDLTLTFELTVFDDMGYGTSDEMNVLVKNIDDFTPLPLNGSISLDPIPKTLDEGMVYVFKGDLHLDGISDYEGKYVQIIDGSAQSEDILSFGTVDKGSVYTAEWTALTKDTSYNIYALYEDGNGTMLKSDSYAVTVQPISREIENLTDTIRGPYIPIEFNSYRNSKLNVYIVAKDDSSVSYIPTAVKAVQHWSEMLQKKTNNPNSWKFNILTSRDFPREQRSTYPINILINLEHKTSQSECHEYGGCAHINWLDRLLNGHIITRVFTGMGAVKYSDDWVSYITSHEFGHALGLGHAWSEGDILTKTQDMMCSSEPRFKLLGIIGFGKKVDTCAGAADIYHDTAKPSEFDVGAVIYAYGKDGFAPPNPRIFADTVYTCEKEPKLCQPSKESSQLRQFESGTQLEPKKPIDADGKKTTKTQNTESGSTLLSYSNSKLGINLEHPTDWKVANLKNGIQLIKEKNGVYVEVRKTNLESSNTKLKQYVDDDIKDRSSSRQDFKLLNKTQSTISGNLPAYKAIYTFSKTENQKDFTNDGTTNRILRIWTFANENAYTVAYVSEKDKYDLYLPIAAKIIDSLKINVQDDKGIISSEQKDLCLAISNDGDTKVDDSGVVSYGDGTTQDCTYLIQQQGLGGILNWDDKKGDFVEDKKLTERANKFIKSHPELNIPEATDKSK